MNNISPEEIKRLISYDPKSGLLRWRPRQQSDFASMSSFKAWNTQFAGREAGSISKTGYVVVSLSGQKMLGHRIAWVIHHGRWPDALMDHVNGLRADNRINNLREATPAQNAQNQRRHKSNKSGVCGVTWHKKTKRWQVRIGSANKSLHVGYFSDLQSAKDARKFAEKQHGFHENHGLAPLTMNGAAYE